MNRAAMMKGRMPRDMQLVTAGSDENASAS